MQWGITCGILSMWLYKCSSCALCSPGWSNWKQNLSSRSLSGSVFIDSQINHGGFLAPFAKDNGKWFVALAFIDSWAVITPFFFFLRHSPVADSLLRARLTARGCGWSHADASGAEQGSLGWTGELVLPSQLCRTGPASLTQQHMPGFWSLWNGCWADLFD